MKVLSEQEKEHLIDLGYEAVRSGLKNGDYLDIDIKVKYMMREQLANLDIREQIYLLRDLIAYLRRRIQVPGGRLGMIALMQVGKMRGVPKFLLDCGTAIWGTLLSGKANSSKLRELFLADY